MRGCKEYGHVCDIYQDFGDISDNLIIIINDCAKPVMQVFRSKGFEANKQNKYYTTNKNNNSKESRKIEWTRRSGGTDIHNAEVLHNKK